MSPLIRPNIPPKRAAFIRAVGRRSVAKIARWAASDLDGTTSPHAPGRKGHAPRVIVRRRRANQLARASRRANRRRAA